MSNEEQIGKEKADVIIGLRITESEKKKLDNYCYKKGYRVSEVVRYALMKFLESK